MEEIPVRGVAEEERDYPTDKSPLTPAQSCVDDYRVIGIINIKIQLLVLATISAFFSMACDIRCIVSPAWSSLETIRPGLNPKNKYNP